MRAFWGRLITVHRMAKISIVEVAARMGVSESTARRELDRPGAPRRYRVSQRCVRWDDTAIEAWLESRAEQPPVELADLPDHLRTPNRRGPRKAA